MRLILIVAVSFMLSACASRLEAGLPLLQGRPIGEAIRYLGHPHGEDVIAGKKVYSWYDEYSITSYDDFGSGVTLGGGFGSRVGPHGGFGVHSGFGFPHRYRTTEVYRCTVRAVTDRNGIIESTDYIGGQASCNKFGVRINQLIEDSQLRVP